VAIGIAFAIHFAWRKVKGNAVNEPAQVAALKPSHFKPTGDGKTPLGMPAQGGARSPASEGAVAAANPEAFAERYAPPEGAEPDLGYVLKEKASPASRRHELAKIFGGLPLQSKGVCQAAEFVGAGPEHVRFTRENWKGVMELYHGAKKELLGWLSKNRASMPEETASLMERQVRELRVRRPPSSDEPDLSWRGIAALSMDDTGLPIVHLGGGFLSLMRADRIRARFELTRVVAQIWNPCELARVGAANPWTGLTECLGVAQAPEEVACGEGTYSEAGWAISTALAARVADPGCKVPALVGANRKSCLQSAFGGAREVASR
jgi:hypothetical protein